MPHKPAHVPQVMVSVTSESLNDFPFLLGQQRSHSPLVVQRDSRMGSPNPEGNFSAAVERIMDVNRT